MAVTRPGFSEYSTYSGIPSCSCTQILRQVGVSIAPQLVQNGGISPAAIANSSRCLIESFLTWFLFDLQGGEDGIGGKSLCGNGTSRRVGSRLVTADVSHGPTGSLAATIAWTFADFERRRQSGISVEARGSAVTDWESDDGSSGSLAGTEGKAKVPVDCERPSCRGARGLGLIEPVLGFEVGRDP